MIYISQVDSVQFFKISFKDSLVLIHIFIPLLSLFYVLCLMCTEVPALCAIQMSFVILTTLSASFPSRQRDLRLVHWYSERGMGALGVWVRKNKHTNKLSPFWQNNLTTVWHWSVSWNPRTTSMREGDQGQGFYNYNRHPSSQ